MISVLKNMLRWPYGLQLICLAISLGQVGCNRAQNARARSQALKSVVVLMDEICDPDSEKAQEENRATALLEQSVVDRLTYLSRMKEKQGEPERSSFMNLTSSLFYDRGRGVFLHQVGQDTTELWAVDYKEGSRRVLFLVSVVRVSSVREWGNVVADVAVVRLGTEPCDANDLLQLFSAEDWPRDNNISVEDLFEVSHDDGVWKILHSKSGVVWSK